MYNNHDNLNEVCGWPIPVLSGYVTEDWDSLVSPSIQLLLHKIHCSLVTGSHGSGREGVERDHPN